MGSLEQTLYEAAKVVTERFESIVTTVIKTQKLSTVSKDITRDFPQILFEYLRRFKAWKIPDEQKLTCRIKHALIALYQAKTLLPADEPKDSKLMVEFETQITRLRAKLLQIAGQTAVDEFDATRAVNGGGEGPPTGGGACGGGDSMSACSCLSGRMTNEQLAHELLLDPMFKLTDDGDAQDNVIGKRIQEAFHQAYWDSLADDYRLTPPCYMRTLRVL